MVGSLERRLIFWENRHDRTTGPTVRDWLYLVRLRRVPNGSRFFYRLGQVRRRLQSARRKKLPRRLAACSLTPLPSAKPTPSTRSRRTFCSKSTCRPSRPGSVVGSLYRSLHSPTTRFGLSRQFYRAGGAGGAGASQKLSGRGGRPNGGHGRLAVSPTKRGVELQLPQVNTAAERARDETRPLPNEPSTQGAHEAPLGSTNVGEKVAPSAFRRPAKKG